MMLHAINEALPTSDFEYDLNMSSPSKMRMMDRCGYYKFELEQEWE